MPIISKKTRYALHGLGYIAARSGSKPLPFHKILLYLRAYSQNLTLSPSYIAKIFQEVSRAGFTEAVSGPRGGYRLSRPPREIPLIDVVEALDGPLLTDCCMLSVGQCARQGACGFGDLIREAEMRFYGFLQRQTVASLARRMDFPDPGTLERFAATGRF